MRVTVYHGTYGCETGCCGHWLDVEETNKAYFVFDHPDSDPSDRAAMVAWAKEAFQGRIPDECLESIDWDSATLVDLCDYDTCPN